MTPVCYNALDMKEDQRFYQEHIVADPRILAGKPVVKGTRIGVDLVLEELAHNPDIAELLGLVNELLSCLVGWRDSSIWVAGCRRRFAGFASSAPWPCGPFHNGGASR